MMMKKIIAITTFLTLLGSSVFTQPIHGSDVWVADNGDGTYRNPVLFADYSDPDVIRVGSDYYLVASSFNCTPGLPILHSKDLVNWRIINYALNKQIPDDVFNAPQHGKGVWAPAIRYHKNEFYIFYPDPDYGVYMIKTKNPASDWSKPVLVLPGKGIIDPCPLWDDDGKVYLITGWAGSRAGVNSLLTVFRMNDSANKVIDEGKHVYDGHEKDHTVEGPKLYKRAGYYYIFAPTGGVTTGWQLVLRSKNIYGPYERKVVMAQGASTTNGPHQGAWVNTITGEDWFLHFQDKGAYGRILHLQPMVWKNDWPVIGIDKNGTGTGEPVQSYKKPNVGKTYPIETPDVSDEFNVDTLGLQWQWHANPKVQWSALIRGEKHLRLFAYPSDTGKNLWTVPNLLLQKLPAPAFTATAKMNYTVDWNVYQHKKAGLIIMGNDYAYLSITKNENGFFISQVVCKNALNNTAEETIEQKPLQSGAVYMRVSINAPDATCVFSYSEDGVNYKTIGTAFAAKPDKWIGAKIGLFCISKPDVQNGGYVDIDWFRVTK